MPLADIAVPAEGASASSWLRAQLAAVQRYFATGCPQYIRRVQDQAAATFQLLVTTTPANDAIYAYTPRGMSAVLHLGYSEQAVIGALRDRLTMVESCGRARPYRALSIPHRLAS